MFLDIWFQTRIEHQILNNPNTWMAIIIFILKKFTPKTYSRPVGPVKPGFLSILVCIFFERNIP
jgi:hypothetical protein